MTRHQLEDALDELVDAVAERAKRQRIIAARLREVAAHTATLVDMARTLAADSGLAEMASDLLFWAEAAQRAIDSWIARPDAFR